MEPSNQPRPAATQPPPARKRSSGLKRIKPNKLTPKSAVILLLVIGLAVLGWLYYDARQENKELSNPQTAVRRDADELKAKVSKFIELPNEQPTVATVSDVEKLKSQEFFKNAQNGDKVLIFTNARRAVLYRPSTNKVIEYAPVNIGNNQTTPPASPPTSP